jgi:hypothetical protein
MEPKFMIFVVAAVLLVPFIATTSIFDVYGKIYPTDTTYRSWTGPKDNKLYSKTCITEFTPKGDVLSAKCMTCELDKKTLKQTNCPGLFKSLKPANPTNLSCKKYLDKRDGKYYSDCQIIGLTPDNSTSMMSQKCELDKKTSKKISCEGYEQILP